MKLTTTSTSPTALLILSLLAATTKAVSLADFESAPPVSELCQSTYGAQIVGCTPDDFVDNEPCSAGCIEALRSITIALNRACDGITAEPDSLIGLFFQGRGVNALCPNARGGGYGYTTSSSPAAVNPTVTDTVTTTETRSTPLYSQVSTRSRPPDETTTTTSTSSETDTQTQTQTETQSTSAETTSPSPPPSSSTTTSTSATTTDVATESSSAAGFTLGGPGFTPPSTLNPGPAPPSTLATVAPSTTSDGQQTADTSTPEVFGGGAIPFTVDDNSSGAASLRTWKSRLHSGNGVIWVGVLGVVSWWLAASL